MAYFKLSIGVIATLVLCGTGHAADSTQPARAQLTVKESVAAREVLTPNQGQWTGLTTRKTLEWDEGQWGVRLDVDQPANRDLRPSDVQAGAYYRVTPALKVGGAVNLGGKSPSSQRATPAERATPTASAGIALKF